MSKGKTKSAHTFKQPDQGFPYLLTKSTVSGHKYFIEVRISIDLSAFFSVQEN